MNDSFDNEKLRAYKRMILGALVGFALLGGSSAFFLWRQGCFEKVPMFTMPPGLAIMVFGPIGSVFGALTSLLSHKWKQ